MPVYDFDEEECRTLEGRNASELAPVCRVVGLGVGDVCLSVKWDDTGKMPYVLVGMHEGRPACAEGARHEVLTPGGVVLGFASVEALDRWLDLLDSWVDRMRVLEGGSVQSRTAVVDAVDVFQNTIYGAPTWPERTCPYCGGHDARGKEEPCPHCGRSEEKA
jgi:hypothetical protein